MNLFKCEPGSELGGSIYNNSGEPVFVRGIKLTKDIMNVLINNGIFYVYINDELSEGIEIDNHIPQELRLETIRRLQSTMKSVDSNNQFNMLSLKNIHELEMVYESLYETIVSNSVAFNFLTTINTQDKGLYLHSVNVALYSIKLSLAHGYSVEETKKLGFGALVHDIGKLLIPFNILNKKGDLTEEEYKIIKSHSELGYELLKNAVPEESAQCAYQHHERLDGSGYPRGLKKSEIHPYAKIIAVSDVFDAITTNRIYQKAKLPHEALKILEKSSPNQLDSRIVEKFPRTIAIYPPGMPLILNTGQKAIVINYHGDIPDRPRVRIVTDENGSILKSAYEVNLADGDEYQIEKIEIN